MTDASFAFLLGTGRCGSTIVGQVLALHPDIGFISNVDDRLSRLNRAGRGNNRVYRVLPPVLQKRGGRRGGGNGGARLGVTPSEAYRLLSRQVSPMLSTPCRDLVAADAHPWMAARLRSFFERRAAAQGRPVFLHKFTGWPRAGLLHAVFPESRLVHVVRDGRAVASSLLQQPWWPGYAGPEGWTFGPLSAEDAAIWEASERSFAVLAGLEWKTLMRAFVAARRAVPGSCWLELRYEDVVERPRQEIGRLLEHVGLEWTDAFEREFSRIEWDRDRRDAYRHELTPVDAGRLEDALASELGAYGY